MRRRSCPIHTDNDATSPNPLTILYWTLDLSRRRYRAWHTHRISWQAEKNARVEVAIQTVYVSTYQMYGPERLQAQWRENEFPTTVRRIKRLRKKRGLRCQ